MNPPDSAGALCPLGTGAVRSWAGMWCGTAGADCYLSRCDSHCLDHPQHYPSHPKLPKVRIQHQEANLS